MPPDRRHLRFQALALTTALAGLTPALFQLTVAEPAVLAGAYFGWTAAVYLLAGVGAVVAAASYSAGDPPRPGWTMLALSYAPLVLTTLVTGPHVGGIETTRRAPVLLAFLEIGYAALGAAGLVVLAAAWKGTGLDTTSRRSRLVARLLAVLVAAALAGPDLVARFPAALSGDAMGITDVVTDLLDGVLLVVAVPVLRAALALGGGLVAWPWALLTLSVFAWLGYDAATLWGGAAGLSPHWARVVEEALRSLAALSLCSAGVAQRWAMLDARAGPGAGAGS